ncbi:MAG: carboxypeptidase, partial [Chitinophagaceae bacterium]
MDAESILSNYEKFKERSLSDRFFKHKTIQLLVEALPPQFLVEDLGQSYEGRAINLISWGNGPVKIMSWSQMHGDESTGTMAVFDLCNYLTAYAELPEIIGLSKKCTLYFIPMVNPDGAEYFTRRNRQQIDINRDFDGQRSPEAKILRQARAEINPHFGFNLHDQNTLWSVKGTAKPATLSYLAPAFNNECDVNNTRENSMKVVADMHHTLSPHLPQRIGLFSETYERRAFGDNFQAAGTSTILIEAGGLENDPEKQEIRQYFFLSLLSGIHSVASGSYNQQTLENYYAIPANSKNLYHIIIHNVLVNGINCSLGLND